jgi:hypothetical protein
VRPIGVGVVRLVCRTRRPRIAGGGGVD